MASGSSTPTWNPSFGSTPGTSSSPEYGITGPTPQDDPYGSQFLAPVAAQPQVAHNFVQFDQKKIPAFFNDTRRDPAPISVWIRRIDNMKTSLGWDGAQTFSNAKNALFGSAAEIIDAQVLSDRTYQNTWDWLKKALKREFDDCSTTRAYVDLIFAIKPQSSVDADLSAFISKIYNDFDRIKGTISEAEVPAAGTAPGNHFTRDEVITEVTKEKGRIVDAFAYAFMVNMLPAEVRTKVLEQKPETITDLFRTTAETRKRLKDERRPVFPGAGPRLNISSANQETAEFDSLVNAVSRKLSTRQTGNNSANNQQSNNQKKKKKQQNNQPNLPKKCNYCHKTGHNTVDCFKRKEDKAPCYTAKGEAFFPEGEQGTKVNQESETEPGEGSDFYGWA
jgi:disulfide oxidoreductase YuzD